MGGAGFSEPAVALPAYRDEQMWETMESTHQGEREGGKALGCAQRLLTLFNRPGLAELLKAKV